jgi:hypothetical protein
MDVELSINDAIFILSIVSIAVWRFGVISIERDDKHYYTVIAYALELEEEQSDDDSESNSIGETNLELAQQAATCLMDHSEMLEDYFSILLGKRRRRRLVDGPTGLT